MKKPVVVIISISSDIGMALAKRYARDGYEVVGTYRSRKLVAELKGIPNCHLFFCDISKKKSIDQFVLQYKKLGYKWDVLVSCPCNPLPLESFFQCDFEEWSDSVHVNSIAQLRLLHQMYLHRKKNKTADVVFFAGGGTNNAVRNFSAYTISKIMLIKMCEFLDYENKDLNVFIVGPGWTKTKTHPLMLGKLSRNDARCHQISEFMRHGAGTSMDDIYDCIRWLSKEGKKVSGGRNFSVVNDQWKGPFRTKLANELRKDFDMYKLRRHKNYFLTKET